MNYYSHHIGDFNNATRHLTRVERSLYRDAIDLYYDTESALTNDFEKLARRLLAHDPAEKVSLQVVLDEFFVLTDAGYTHTRCDEEIAKYRANTSAKAKAGIASAASRKQKSTGVEQVLDGCLTNQEPITNNHKPITKGKQSATPTALPDFFSDVDLQVVSDFKAMRSKQKAPITKTAIDGIQSEALKAGLSLEGALRICCERSWRGFKAEWVTQPSRASPSHQTPNEKAKAFADRLTGNSNDKRHAIIDIN